MKRIKGFTLIEVMVVLSILALLAILAYNFFGSSMRDASVEQKIAKVHNDLRIINEATELWYKDNKTWTGFTFQKLVDDGYLKSLPVQDPTLNYDGSSCSYDFAKSYMSVGGTGSSDFLIYSCDGKITNEVCNAYNEKHTDFGAVSPNYNDYPANWFPQAGTDFKGGSFCLNFNGCADPGCDRNTIYWIQEVY